MRKSIAGSFAAAAIAVALALVPALPASAVTITTGAKSCNSGYTAQTWGYYRYVGTHRQYTGSWHQQNVSSEYFKWNASSANTQSFSNSNVSANSLQYGTTGCA